MDRLGPHERLGGHRQVHRMRMKGCVWNPPMPPWKEISSSKAQPSWVTGS